MSILMDGISNVYSLTAQIDNLKAGGKVDSEAIKLTLEQNFNQMLSDLISSSEDDDDEENHDIFDSIITYNQSYLETLTDQKTSAKPNEQINLDDSLGSTSYLDSLYALQDNPLALQSFLKADLDTLV